MSTTEHPEYSRDPLAIKFSVARTGPKCLERQVREAVQLANMDPDRIINTHMEFVASAIQRMTHVKTFWMTGGTEPRGTNQSGALKFLNSFISVFKTGSIPWFLTNNHT